MIKKIVLSKLKINERFFFANVRDNKTNIAELSKFFNYKWFFQIWCCRVNKKSGSISILQKHKN